MNFSRFYKFKKEQFPRNLFAEIRWLKLSLKKSPGSLYAAFDNTIPSLCSCIIVRSASKCTVLYHTACLGIQVAKNQPLLIYSSRCLRDSQKPKTKTIFQFLQWIFQKIPFLYFFLHKSLIWRTLGQVMDIFSYCHLHKASKEL